MLKPKYCFGVVMAGALVCAAAVLTAARTSAATNVTARTRRTDMDPPPRMGGGYSIRSTCLERRAERRGAGLGNHAVERRGRLVDRAVGIRSVEERIAPRVERIGVERIARRGVPGRPAVARAGRTGERRARHAEPVALLQ